MLGKLEETILLATLRAGEKAVPSSIHGVMVESVQPGEREPAFGAVYTTLARMSDKGLLSTGTMTDEKGRARKTFTVTAQGRRALDASLQMTKRLGGFVLAGAVA